MRRDFIEPCGDAENASPLGLVAILAGGVLVVGLSAADVLTQPDGTKDEAVDARTTCTVDNKGLGFITNMDDGSSLTGLVSNGTVKLMREDGSAITGPVSPNRPAGASDGVTETAARALSLCALRLGA